MADVKWIKITTDMFDNRKIKHLRKLPDGNNIVLIWVMLLTMAGRCNASGMIFLTENIPYTIKMLADELGFEENTVILALDALERFDMVVCNEGVFTIAGWEEHQNIDGLEKLKEQNRIRVAKHREKQKLLGCNITGNVTSNVTVMECNAIDIDKELEKEKDKNNILNEFEILWKMYPNKKGKDKALGYYQKARKNGTTFENVEQGIKNYCKEIEAKKTEKQYIQHGSTWFNNKGWLDDYDFTSNTKTEQKTSKYSYTPDDGSDLPF